MQRRAHQPPSRWGDANKALQLIFGEGELRVAAASSANFNAVLDFGGVAAMDLYGAYFDGFGVRAQVVQIAGTGREGTSTAEWVYRYLGYRARLARSESTRLPPSSAR